MPLPYILMIAPHAPPKNTAEAIQVGRLLAALDSKARGRVVYAESSGGWSANDATLQPNLTNFTFHALGLPLHRFTSRLIGSRYAQSLHRPDSLFWMRYFASRIARGTKPDVIYSRSGPVSGALLARALKQRLGTPWIMHLSDPWADNPGKVARAADHAIERQCFAEADRISLTCEGQADFYRAKYPEYTGKIFIAPNMLPAILPATPAPVAADGALKLVYTGNLYGSRSPAPLVQALAHIQERTAETLAHLEVHIYGHAQPEALALLASQPKTITYHGPVSYAQAMAAQQMADILLSIDPAESHPLEGCYLPSKVLDAMAMGKPLLAITSAHSETAKLCREGYGWALAPTMPEAIAERITACVDARAALRQQTAKAPPAHFKAEALANGLLEKIAQLGVR